MGPPENQIQELFLLFVYFVVGVVGWELEADCLYLNNRVFRLSTQDR